MAVSPDELCKLHFVNILSRDVNAIHNVEFCFGGKEKWNILCGFEQKRMVVLKR